MLTSSNHLFDLLCSALMFGKPSSSRMRRRNERYSLQLLLSACVSHFLRVFMRFLSQLMIMILQTSAKEMHSVPIPNTPNTVQSRMYTYVRSECPGESMTQYTLTLCA